MRVRIFGALLVIAAGCGGDSVPETAGADTSTVATEEPAPPAADASLLQPTSPAFQATAPDTFRVRFETTKGEFTVAVNRAWSPNGVDRFYNLVRNGYYNDVAFFRVVPGFMVQFGIHGDPAVSGAWRPQRIPDDPVVESNRRGYVSFAMAGPNTRTTQLFINFADNSQLDGMGFSPIGRVVEGMEVVDAIYGGYGEGAPQGQGPEQGRVQAEGNEYLRASFPQLDYIRRATVEE
jgi:peptidyl-prolyl cis-trans isomerase A (cyclophilin A)